MRQNDWRAAVGIILGSHTTLFKSLLRSTGSKPQKAMVMQVLRVVQRAGFLRDITTPRQLNQPHLLIWAAEFSSSCSRSHRRSSRNQWKPLGLKEGVTTTSGLTPTMQILAAYVVVGLSAMVVVARYKSRDAQEDEVRGLSHILHKNTTPQLEVCANVTVVLLPLRMCASSTWQNVQL